MSQNVIVRDDRGEISALAAGHGYPELVEDLLTLCHLGELTEALRAKFDSKEQAFRELIMALMRLPHGNVLTVPQAKSRKDTVYRVLWWLGVLATLSGAVLWYAGAGLQHSPRIAPGLLVVVAGALVAVVAEDRLEANRKRREGRK